MKPDRTRRLAEATLEAGLVLGVAALPTAWRVLDARLAREDRAALAQACFDFLPHRAELDLAGWPDADIFAHA